MPTSTATAIKIRISARDQTGEKRDPREAFWAGLRNNERFTNLSISRLEVKLSRELGKRLKSALVDQVSEGLSEIRRRLRFFGDGDIEHFFFRFIDRPSKWDGDAAQMMEALARLFEQQRELMREMVPRRATERVIAASQAIFSARVSGYSSLNLDLSTASFTELATVFEGNFDAIQVFLDAFVPSAFGEIFDEDFADRFDFDVNIPAPFRQAFDEAAARTSPAASSLGLVNPAEAPVPPTAQATARSNARERAEWAWRLANGSLIVPFMLALAVMYYGLKLLSDLGSSQYGALQPILQHQLLLLEQDRLRLTAATAGSSKEQPVTTTSTGTALAPSGEASAPNSALHQTGPSLRSGPAGER